MSLRFLFYALLVFFLWRIVQAARRVISNSRKGSDNVFETMSQQKSSKQNLSNIQDADFEDITPKEKDADKNKPPAP